MVTLQQEKGIVMVLKACDFFTIQNLSWIGNLLLQLWIPQEQVTTFSPIKYWINRNSDFANIICNAVNFYLHFQDSLPLSLEAPLQWCNLPLKVWIHPSYLNHFPLWQVHCAQSAESNDLLNREPPEAEHTWIKKHLHLKGENPGSKNLLHDNYIPSHPVSTVFHINSQKHQHTLVWSLNCPSLTSS